MLKLIKVGKVFINNNSLLFLEFYFILGRYKVGSDGLLKLKIGNT